MARAASGTAGRWGSLALGQPDLRVQSRIPQLSGMGDTHLLRPRQQGDW